MKTLKLAWILILGLLAAACDDDDELKSTNKISSEEQAEMVAAAMGKSGFVGSSEQTTEHADNATAGRLAACGYNNESSGSFSGNIGSDIFFSLSYAYDVELECESEEPKRLVSEFTYEGSYDGPRLETDHSGSGTLIVTQLNDENDHYQMDGSYKREGSFESNIGDHATGSASFGVDVNNVQINKSTKAIESGSANASVRGSISGKGNYSFDAKIVFNNNGTANITVSGHTYIVNLATGEVLINSASS